MIHFKATKYTKDKPKAQKSSRKNVLKIVRKAVK